MLEILGVEECLPRICTLNLVLLLSVWFISNKMNMEPEPGCLKEILVELGNWSRKTETTGKEVESMIGVLSFVSKCVRPSSIYFR